ncbi:glutamate formimidoyltransferase [bacterium]|nr:glutamate formimidoyltransferase [bacterium]
MAKILSSPNFSEGNSKEIIEQILAPIREIEGVKIIDYSSDPDHNRSVVSLIGEPQPLLKALLEASRRAVALINLNNHEGEHPRCGAVDVIPLIPLKDISLEECVRYAHDLGELLAKELHLPVYFYGEAALKEERRDLSDVRKGGIEAIKEDMRNGRRLPDLGPPQPHPTAGCVIVGVRDFLIAFNVNLASTNLEIAKKIASSVREKGGGLLGVKALGINLASRGMVQVSMNITMPFKTPLYRVYELVKIEARKYGVEIDSAEIIGPVPLQVLIDTLSYYLPLKDFKLQQVIDIHI